MSDYIFGIKPYENIYVNSYIKSENYYIAYYPKGTIIFRGASEDEIDITENKYPTWFASYSTAYEYNEQNIRIYKTTRDMFLLILSDVDNQKQLLKDMERLRYVGTGRRSDNVTLKEVLFSDDLDVKPTTQKLFKLSYGLDLTVEDKTEIIEALEYELSYNEYKFIEGRLSEYESDKILFNDLCHLLPDLHIDLLGEYEKYLYFNNKYEGTINIIANNEIGGFVSGRMPRTTIIPKTDSFYDYNIFYEEIIICSPKSYLIELNENDLEYQEAKRLGQGTI